MTAPYTPVTPFGATPGEVIANFAGIANANLKGGADERIIGSLSTTDLASLRAQHRQSTGGDDHTLWKILAPRLSDDALLKVAAVFGRSAVTQAVDAYSSPAVKASFFTKLAEVQPIGDSTSTPAMQLPPPPPPSTDWTDTLRDIYLDYRTSPTLDMGVGESLSATTIYAATGLYLSWEAGTAIGTWINNQIQTDDPSLSDAIGGTVANMLTAAVQSYDELQEGQYEASFDNLFGLPISDSSNPSGPDGLTDPMVMYYGDYGYPSGYGGSGSGLCGE